MNLVGRSLAIILISGMGPSETSAHDRCGRDQHAVMSEYKDALHRFLRKRARTIDYTSPSTALVLVSISVDRGGFVVSSDIVRQSGAPVFDRLVLRAFPVGLQGPPVPACTDEDRITLTFPLRYHARL